MTPALGWLLAITIALLFVFLIIYTKRKERERTEALRRVAEAKGFSFEPVAELAAVRALGNVQLFDQGHSRRVKNLMTGRLGEAPVAIFDYWLTTGSGKHQHTHAMTVLMLPSAKPSLPDLQMAPENPLIKIFEMFGYQDIDIEASPEFSSRYIVRGADDAGIRAALYPGATSYFAEHEGWTIEVRSGTVAIYRADRRPKPEDMAMFIEEASTAARHL